jgi:NTE family protein
VGVALGGGFARGLAHIGVLKVLVENQIPIDALAGASVGSIVAAGFASGLSPLEMMVFGRRTQWRTFARWTVSKLGLATNERMAVWLRSTLRGLTFEDLAIPLSVVAADISTGEAVTFQSGDLIPPLRASCSFPGLFVPIAYQGRLLVDGAIVDSVPVSPLRESRVGVIVGVHLKVSDRPGHVPANLFQVIGQSFQIAQGRNRAAWRDYCDVVIEPEVSGFSWDDFKRIDELVEAGERAAKEALSELRALVKSRTVIATQPNPAHLPTSRHSDVRRERPSLSLAG